MTRQADSRLADIALAALAIGALAGGVLHTAGRISAAWAGLPPPDGTTADALRVLATPLDPAGALGAPGLDAWRYWLVVTTLLATLAAAAALLWRLAAGRADRTSGLATAAEVRRSAGPRALRRRAATLRPSLDKAEARDLGYQLGTCRGQQVWAAVEDSILILGPPRSGKGLHLVINAVLDAPGAVITTSTRPDTLAVTLSARQQVGPVAVFDPQRLAPGVSAGLRWSLVRGCSDPLTAMIRAAGLSSATGLAGGAVDNGGFWEAKTRVAVQSLLHAAALDGRDARDVYRWALNPAAAVDAVRILHTNTAAADGWADALDGMVTADPRTRDSIWHGVAVAFSALADPRVLHAVTPIDDTFDPATFLQNRGTLYLLATGAGAGNSAALVAAFIEDLTETARRLAATAPAARLDPPLLLALDEIGNLAPLPSLPTLMAEGGGTGITTMPVLQSLAQARSRWGEHAAAAIWDAAIVKVILGGGSASRDLHDLSALLGDRDEPTTTTSTDSTGSRSRQQSMRRVPVMSVDKLRTLPFGTALVLLRTAPPILTTLQPWTRRHDATALTADRARIQQLLSTSA